MILVSLGHPVLALSLLQLLIKNKKALLSLSLRIKHYYLPLCFLVANELNNSLALTEKMQPLIWSLLIT